MLLRKDAFVRTLRSMQSRFHVSRRLASTSSSRVYIAMGSNLGNRVKAIHDAFHQLKDSGILIYPIYSLYSQKDNDISFAEVFRMVKTSFLYESKPKYHTDQPAFLNAVCAVDTEISPLEVLSELKRIEESAGRVKSFVNGPRLIDLDILLFGDQCVSTPTLTIPHLRLHERAFVLRPLFDINPELRHPTLQSSVSSLLQALPVEEKNSLRRVFPMSPSFSTSSVPSLADFEETGPLIMGILNVTPDSFSDGGVHNTVDEAVKHAHRMVSAGATIIDIGGESTRPNAQEVTVEEELHRVIPVLEALNRNKPSSAKLSVDTRSSVVAEAAIAAGADMINDVSGGRHDTHMIPMAASRMAPIILMHSRGTPATMSSLTNYTSSEGLIREISDELQKSLSLADKLLPRWLQYIDPGIGFAKNQAQNLFLLKPESIRMFRSLLDDRPLLIGASRKRFIRAIIERGDGSRGIPQDISYEELDAGTSAVTSAAVLGGADIIRVHNVRAAYCVSSVMRAISDNSGM